MQGMMNNMLHRWYTSMTLSQEISNIMTHPGALFAKYVDMLTTSHQLHGVNPNRSRKVLQSSSPAGLTRWMTCQESLSVWRDALVIKKMSSKNRRCQICEGRSAGMLKLYNNGLSCRMENSEQNSVVSSY